MPYEAKTNWKYDDTVTEKDLNRIEQGLKDAHVAEYKDITLQPGVQIVDVPEDTPFRMGEIRGRTLVNLLGRSWSAYGGKMSFGDGMYTIEGSGNVPNPQLSANLTSTGFVPKVGDLLFLRSKCRVDNTTCKAIGLYFYSKSTDRNYAAEIIKPMANQVYVIGGIIEVTQAMIDDWADMIAVVAYEYNTNGDALNTVNKVSEVALYRVSESVSDQSVSELLVSYPYVDSMKNVKHPYAIATNGNLLPPFTEWTINNVATVQAPYELLTNPTASGQATEIYVPVNPGETYTLSYETNDVTKGYMNWAWLDGEGRVISWSPAHKENYTETAPNNAVKMKMIVTSISAGTFTFKNPILVPGDKPQPFTPQSRSMWAAECQLAANPVDGTNTDVLYVGDDGLPYVLEKWAKITLDGWLPWEHVSYGDNTFKVVSIAKNKTSYPDSNTNWSGELIKYDGTKLNLFNSTNNGWGKDEFAVDINRIQLTVSNTDSGWGDSYTPTVDEIKAYFLGWKMTVQGSSTGVEPYDNSGTKVWVNIMSWDGTKFYTPGATPTLPTRVSDPYWQPYRLQYLKAKPTVEPVSNYETDLTLSTGWNVVEVGSGVVIREKTTPTTVGLHYLVNHNEVPASILRHKTNNIMTVYRNNRNESRAVITRDHPAGLGGSFVYVTAQDYDPSAVYHVTYTMLDPTLAAIINGSIAINLRGAVTDMVSWASDAERRLSVVENGAQDNLSPESIGAAKKSDLDGLTKNSVCIKNGTSKDLNAYREPGLFFIGSLNEYANSPSNDAMYSWGILRVETLGTTAYVVQSYTCILNNVTFTRSKAEDASSREWMPWRMTSKLDADGVLRLNKWLDIRSDGPAANLYGSTHVYQQFIVNDKRVGYVGSGDPRAPQNISLASDSGDIRLWAGTGGVFVNDRNILWEIDQLKQSGVNNKQALVDALNAKGIAASVNEDWGALISKIQQTTYMRSVQINHESEIRASQNTFESVATIPAGVKRIIFTTTSNWATKMYTTYDNPTLMFALKDVNGSYQNLASNYYDSYYYRDVTLYSFMVDFTINTARSSYHVHEWNLINNDGIRISNSGEIQFGFYYFTNGYYSSKGTTNGLLQYE
ncbi:pyocin knob domain-containing protein [Paenibacillus alvei]|uniref:pyocin knob domain-containing protein n=1 Tax=Paenibacillus alvei TaxID=44250 RepID=UPI002280AF57|nr:pyocin knob domain-containing protein [Paenibacillus alvei]MCY7484761.1 pyocin knob domain-containing protein [Paenibacillus alvei]